MVATTYSAFPDLTLIKVRQSCFREFVHPVVEIRKYENSEIESVDFLRSFQLV